MKQVNNGTKKVDIRQNLDKETIDREKTDLISECDICRKRLGNNHLRRQYVRHIQRIGYDVCSSSDNEYNMPSQFNVSYHTQTTKQEKSKERTQRLESVIQQIKLRITKQQTTRGVQREKIRCPVCNKEMLKRHIKRHERVHTNERPYACIVCGDKFSRMDYLHQHMPLHGDEKKYTCDVCGMAYKQQSSLSRHKRIHISS